MNVNSDYVVSWILRKAGPFAFDCSKCNDTFVIPNTECILNNIAENDHDQMAFELITLCPTCRSKLYTDVVIGDKK